MQLHMSSNLCVYVHAENEENDELAIGSSQKYTEQFTGVDEGIIYMYYVVHKLYVM